MGGQRSATECSIGHREARRTRTRGTPDDRLAASEVVRGVCALRVSAFAVVLLFGFGFFIFSSRFLLFSFFVSILVIRMVLDFMGIVI